jgi:virulence-associated protein VapD
MKLIKPFRYKHIRKYLDRYLFKYQRGSFWLGKHKENEKSFHLSWSDWTTKIEFKKEKIKALRNISRVSYFDNKDEDSDRDDENWFYDEGLYVMDAKDIDEANREIEMFLTAEEL